jgi:uncharacterized protein YjbI with pentapeptide repeats
MANAEQLVILQQGAEVWNEWRFKNLGEKIDLSGANLYKADLHKAALDNVNLSGADFRKADLSSANLCGTELLDVNFSWADLNRANLRWANLNSANLYKANLFLAEICPGDLHYANLYCAELGSADLTGSDMYMACLREANLAGSRLDHTRLYGVDLIGANLTGATLNNADLEKANLTNCKVYGISAWELKLKDTMQRDLIITPRNKPVITVDNLEVAQFIYLLLNNEKIRYMIDSITSKVVLILGRFTTERKAVLDAIREELRRRDYVPILFDFVKPDNRDTTETVATLAHMARFIIADITDPSSIPLELQAIIPDLAVPIQPLIMEGSMEFSMFRDLRRKYHWVLQVHTYKDINNLIPLIGENLISSAEAKVIELKNH